MRHAVRIRSAVCLLACVLAALGFFAFKKNQPSATPALRTSAPETRPTVRSYPLTPPLTSPAPTAADDAPSEYDGTNVQDIDVRGAIRTSESTMLKTMRTRKGRPFDMRDWNDDYKRLLAMGRFAKIQVFQPTKVPGGIRLTLEVVENPQIGEIKINMLNHKELESSMVAILNSVYDSEEMDPVYKDLFERTRTHLARAMFERSLKSGGFYEAKVDYEVTTVGTYRGRSYFKDSEFVDLVNLAYNVDLGTFARIRALAVKNTRAFGEAAILNGLESKAGAPFSAEDLHADRERIQSFYLRHGFADVKVSSPTIADAGLHTWKANGETIRLFDVTFDIDEGDQAVVGEVRFTGNAHIEARELLRIAATKSGALLLDDTLGEDMLRIQKYYADRGWRNAQVGAQRTLVTDPARLKFAPHPWDVTFQIVEGGKPIKLNFARDNNAMKSDVILDAKDGEPAELLPEPSQGAR